MKQATHSATFFARLIMSMVISGFLFPISSVRAASNYQIETPEQRAAETLESLIPEERVGQLFLVTFKGPEALPNTIDSNQIYELVTKYHIGGVILRADNNNFVGGDQTIRVVESLVDALQRSEYVSALSDQPIPNSQEYFRPAFIPLFIGLSQNGDGYPYDQILSGLTPLPNQMTIGATWKPDLARQVGVVLGSELSTLGINMLIGPSLDVLESPYSETGGDLGVRTFGGDPYWVGEMGKAYIAGVHEGANNRMVVVGKNFPGFGGSDRLPEEDVTTVRKNLEQLKQFELYPFFSVTGNAPNAQSTVDALLTAHIRYQGFQENFRQTTRPVSFDPNALSQLIAQPALNSWRTNGGILISDNLASRAVRRFYDPTGATFNGRTVAVDAFLAGNDMLYLGDFIASGDPDAQTTITRTLTYFARKYREDSAFAQRVDESVLRILTMKYRLYNSRFTLNQTLPQTERNSTLGQSNQVSFEVARFSATLISPVSNELDPTIPQLRDKIIVITDTRTSLQCSSCKLFNSIPVNALEQAIVRLYGQDGGPILPANLLSYSFVDLQQMLDAGIGQLLIENDIRQAQWVVFLTQDVNPSYPSSNALRRFLDERPDLHQGRRIIVFAMNAPYFLGGTDISKLTAYYGLYSRSTQFIDIAARLLFQEVPTPGNLPVSMPGISYDINAQTFPDPDQIIELFLDSQNGPGEATPTANPTPEAGGVQATVRIGDLLTVHTGTILDHNGHIVPDGTIVRFILSTSSDTTITKQLEALTVQGVARAIFQVEVSGNIEIRVESDPAKQSEILRFVAPPENITPTISPTASPSPTATQTPTITPTELPQPTSTPEPTPPEPPRTTTADWIASFLIALGIGLGGFGIGAAFGYFQQGVRASLLAIIGGLLGYTYLALSLPGTAAVLENGGPAGIVAITFGGAVAGLLISLVWPRSNVRKTNGNARN